MASLTTPFLGWLNHQGSRLQEGASAVACSQILLSARVAQPYGDYSLTQWDIILAARSLTTSAARDGMRLVLPHTTVLSSPAEQQCVNDRF